MPHFRFMLRSLLSVGIALLALCVELSGVDGAQAMRHVEKLVAIGPRAAGSKQLEAARRYIEAQIAATGLQVERQPFAAATPGGPLQMANLLVKIPIRGSNSAQRVLISGHYDTKRFLDRNFVGANDGGSSTALLLELARVLSKSPPLLEVWIVFFDGEEAIGTWSDTDSLYGSRHLAQHMQLTGELAKVRALINVDMVGDRDLQLLDEYYSDARLRTLAREVAGAMGKPRLFTAQSFAIEDDHVPFVRRGVPALNLIDFDYGPGNRYWHTDQDSLDKLSAESFATVGRLVLGILSRLEQETAGQRR
ncbi:MAG: M28 family peptidase [Bryobacterales bacterium]|nr:M28 family peptidase [Bryobacterales bacterium]